MSGFNRWMIDPNDAVMLLIDHQSGLFQLVRDIDQPVLRHNVCALAKVQRNGHRAVASGIEKPHLSTPSPAKAGDSRGTAASKRRARGS